MTSRFKFSVQQSIKYSKFIISLLILFHLTLILQIICFDYKPSFVWAGNQEYNILYLEFISITISIVCLILLEIYQNKKWKRFKSISKIGIGLFGVLFALNTIANLFAPSLLEQSFTIITIVLTLMFFHIGFSKT